MKILTFLFPLSLLSAASSLAAEIVTPQKHPIAQVEWHKLSGLVEERDLENRKLRLRDKNGNVAQVTIDPDVQIFKYWRLVAFNDIHLQDHVILRRTHTGLQ